MGLSFVFPCTAFVLLSLVGTTTQGRAIGAESGAVATAEQMEVLGLPAGLPKRKERARRDGVEQSVKPDGQPSGAQEEALRSRRAEADRRAVAFLFLLQVLRSPK